MFRRRIGDGTSEDLDFDSWFVISVQTKISAGFSPVFQVASERAASERVSRSNTTPGVNTTTEGFGDGSEITDVLKFGTFLVDATAIQIRV